MNDDDSKEYGLSHTQGLEVDLKIYKSNNIERGVSDRKYAPALFGKSMIALISAIVLAVIAGLMRVVLIK